MAKKPRSEQEPNLLPTTATNWKSAQDRVRWLLENRFQGNRSAFAEMIGFSHTIIGKVVAGQAPGRKLLAAIAEKMRVNSEWLLTGKGQPYGEAPDSAGRPGLPVCEALLPGPPLEHQELITGGWLHIPDQLHAASQYWLRLTSSQPIVRDPLRGFRAGDHLLLETDRERFPRQKKLFNDLCVVRAPTTTPSLKLGVVTHHDADVENGPDRLEVDTFDLAPDPAQMVTKRVYRHYPGGEVTYEEQPLQIQQTRHGRRAGPISEMSLAPALPVIRYADIIAVWTNILHRPGRVPR